jgi:branched-chain amino acid transport system substrate-binding protein
MMKHFFKPWVLLVALSIAQTHVFAQIKIGMVLPMSGPLAATGMDIAAGSQAFFSTLNARGGVSTGALKGQKIELLIEDDKFDPALSETLARRLIKEEGVSAILSCFGTVSCLAIAKVADETKVPLIGPIAGAPALRKVDNKYVFSLRADAIEEVGALVNYLKGIGQNESAVLIQDDGFGNAYAAALKTAANKAAFSISLSLSFDPKKPNYTSMAAALIARQPESVMLMANTQHSIGIIQALNVLGYTGQVLNLAGQANGVFVKSLRGGKQIAVFSMMTPSPMVSASVAANDYRAGMDKTGQKTLSYLSFEAYLNARLLGGALQRAGNATPTVLTNTVQALKDFDLGVFKVTFSGNYRQGASYTDLAVLTADGRFRH